VTEIKKLTLSSNCHMAVISPSFACVIVGAMTVEKHHPYYLRLSRYGEIGFSHSMWERIDRGEVNEKAVYDTMRRAFDIFSNHEIRSRIDFDCPHNPGDDRDIPPERIAHAKQYALDEGVRLLSNLIAESPRHFDVNAMASNADTKALTLFARAMRYQLNMWQDVSYHPLMDLLLTHGASIDYLQQEASSDRGPDNAPNFRRELPENLFHSCREPQELACLLNYAKDIEPGVLAHQVTKIYKTGAQTAAFLETIQVGLDHGLSVYEVSPKLSYSTIDMAKKVLLFRQRSLGDGSPSATRDMGPIEQARAALALLTERIGLANQTLTEWREHPDPGRLTREKMIQLANIDELDGVLSTVKCNKEQATALLHTLGTMDPFLPKRMPISITRLERIAGKDIVSSVAHNGTVAAAPSRAMGEETA